MTTVLLRILAGASLTVLTQIAAAQEPITKSVELNIDAPKLARALIQLSEQAGLQLIYPAGDKVVDLPATPLSGTYTPQAALDSLLKSSGLKYEFLDDRTIAIVDPSAKPVSFNNEDVTNGPKAAGSSLHMRGEEWGMRVAQATDEQSDANKTNPSRAREAGESSDLEEVVVTAQKRVERLQDVPISITALTGEQLDSSSTGSVTEALKAVPGVAVLAPRNGIGSTMTIRGVPGGDWFVPASIAYYLDSIPLSLAKNSLNLDANSYDLDRIEVLRGPQGTLYGAAAQAGVVRVLTKDPNVDEFEFKARGLVSGSSEGGTNYQANAAANFPILPGKLAARVTAGYRDFGGWIDKPNREDVNDTRLSDVRLKLRFQPSEALTIDTSAWVVRTDSNGPSVGFDDYTSVSTAGEPSLADYDVYNARIAYDFAFASLTSSSSYLDAEFGNVLSYEPFVGLDFLQISQFTGKVFTEELQLASQGEGPWRWTLGGFYRNARDLGQQAIVLGSELNRPLVDYITHLTGDTGIYPASALLLGLGRDTSKSYAVFGELTRSFADGKFDLTGGLRYFEDKVTTLNYANAYSAADTFHSVSPRVVLTWHMQEDAMAYASVGKGFRSGQLQDFLANSIGYPSATPENLYNYEVGAKATMFDRRLDIDTALYFVKRKGIIQVLSIPLDLGDGRQTLTGASINGPGASGLGVDFALTLRPMQGVRLGINGSVNDLTFDEDVVTFSIDSSTTPPTFEPHLIAAEGERTNGSPRTTLGAFADYTFPLGGAEATLAASANHRSSILYNRNDVPPVTSDSVTIASASFGVSLPSDWTITAFVDNLTDENPVVGRDTFGPYWDVRARPRTIGVQVEVKY